MRILAIGFGGAGCRIVNNLHATDRRSSKVLCVQALAIDVDSDTLAQLESLPENAKLFFPPLDPVLHPEEERENVTATIDVGEIVSRIQNFESGETDAIFVCCGLGGSMVDVAPHIIASLRSSTTEPIFGLVTLPCLAEGERHSAKAADDIEMLSPLLDGIILFDNETWYKKTKANRSTLVKKETGLAEKLGFRKKGPDISPELATYLLLNEAIVRRISLILRAGEFKADGGLDLAEVVLDSGEVLNTMKGMGYITIGYAVERLPQHPLSFLTSWYPTGLFPDAHKIKASRIVDLAKQAIYHEISTPCDMTSAHKALILIAGPSHELSMKGFMTVRKWIDRSIAGLETRSGDYPVMNTKNVAIIIMLSGLENIPRISELKEIQNQYKSSHQDALQLIEQSGSGITISAASERTSTSRELIGESASYEEKKLKDEMVVLPVKSRKSQISDTQDSGKFGQFEKDYSADMDSHQSVSPLDALPQKIFFDSMHGEAKRSDLSLKPHIIKETDSKVFAEDMDKSKMQENLSSRFRAGEHDKPQQSEPKNSTALSSAHEISRNKRPVHDTDSRKPHEKPHTADDRVRTREMERQIIERELLRQRTIAISGLKPKAEPGSQKLPIRPSEIVTIKKEISKKTILKKDPEQSGTPESPPLPVERKRVLIQRKGVRSEVRDPQIPEQGNESFSDNDDDRSFIKRSDADSSQGDSKEKRIEIKNSMSKSKDHIYNGKSVHTSASPQVRDSALIHTHLKSKKKHLALKIEDEQENIDKNA